MSAYCFSSTWLWPALKQVKLSPKGEYYLTDLVGLAVSDGLAVQAVVLDDAEEAVGINTRVHLAEAEAIIRRRINERWMLAGVTLVDPESVFIGADVQIGKEPRSGPTHTCAAKRSLVKAAWLPQYDDRGHPNWQPLYAVDGRNGRCSTGGQCFHGAVRPLAQGGPLGKWGAHGQLRRDQKFILWGRRPRWAIFPILAMRPLVRT